MGLRSGHETGVEEVLMLDSKRLNVDQIDLAYGIQGKTGEAFTIKIESPIGRIAAILLDETGMGPLPDLAYELWLDDKLIASGKTDADGYLCHCGLKDDYYVLKIGDEDYCVGTIGDDDDPDHICVLGQDCDWTYGDFNPELDGDPNRSRL